MAKKGHIDIDLPEEGNTTPEEQAAETQTPETAATEQTGDQPDAVNTAPVEQVPETGADQPEQDPLAEKAKELFARYPQVGVFYFTADATGFFTANDAKNYAATLKDQTVKTIKR